MHGKIVHILLASIFISAVVGCGGSEESKTDAKREKPLVAVTFFPLHFLTQKIAGDTIDLVCPLPDGADPIFWKPGDEDITTLRDADLVIANGAGFEKWMTTISLPESRVLMTAAPLEDELIYIKDGPSHNHGVQGAHSHVGKDGHTWVDLENARIQAREILNALIRILPDKADGLRRRHLDLDKKMAALAAKFHELGQSKGKTPLLASHPAYNYLARRIGLNLATLDLSPDEKLDKAALKTVEDALKGHDAKYMLWESQPIPAIEKQLKELFGVQCVEITPCEDPGLARTTPASDFIGLMAVNLENLRRALAN